PPHPPPPTLFPYTTLFRSRKAMDRARQNERALAQRNQDLQREIVLHSQAEDAYRLLVEQMSQGLLIFQNSHITYANHAVAELCGDRKSTRLNSSHRTISYA